VAFATSWILVHTFDQLAECVHAIADDQRWIASGGGDQLVADHQQAVVVAGNVALDEDFVADFKSDRVGGFDLLTRTQVDRDALALVAILRLDDDRSADLAGGGPGVLGAEHRPTSGYRNPGSMQQNLAQLLVLGDRFGDRAGTIGFRCLNPPLAAAPAELHHAALGQPAVGNVARHCRIDDGAGTGSQAHILVEFAQTVERLVEFERLVVDGRAAKVLGKFEGQSANRLFAVFDDHLVGAASRSAPFG
jgi:hypothetical protein